MRLRDDIAKIYTLRHFAFYMGITWGIAAIVLVTAEILGLSYGLSVATVCVIGLIVPAIALRESLFAPAEKPNRRRRGRHA